MDADGSGAELNGFKRVLDLKVSMNESAASLDGLNRAVDLKQTAFRRKCVDTCNTETVRGGGAGQWMHS